MKHNIKFKFLKKPLDAVVAMRIGPEFFHFPADGQDDSHVEKIYGSDAIIFESLALSNWIEGNKDARDLCQSHTWVSETGAGKVLASQAREFLELLNELVTNHADLLYVSQNEFNRLIKNLVDNGHLSSTESEDYKKKIPVVYDRDDMIEDAKAKRDVELASGLAQLYKDEGDVSRQIYWLNKAKYYNNFHHHPDQLVHHHRDDMIEDAEANEDVELALRIAQLYKDEGDVSRQIYWLNKAKHFNNAHPFFAPSEALDASLRGIRKIEDIRFLFDEGDSANWLLDRIWACPTIEALSLSYAGKWTFVNKTFEDFLAKSTSISMIEMRSHKGYSIGEMGPYMKASKVAAEHVKVLTNILQLNHSIEHLDISGWQIGDEGLIDFVNALIANHETKLKTLYVSYNDVTELGAAYLLENIDKIPSLCRVSMNQSDQPSGLKSTIEAIEAVLEARKAMAVSSPDAAEREISAVGAASGAGAAAAVGMFSSISPAAIAPAPERATTVALGGKIKLKFLKAHHVEGTKIINSLRNRYFSVDRPDSIVFNVPLHDISDKIIKMLPVKYGVWWEYSPQFGNDALPASYAKDFLESLIRLTSNHAYSLYISQNEFNALLKNLVDNGHLSRPESEDYKKRIPVVYDRDDMRNDMIDAAAANEDVGLALKIAQLYEEDGDASERSYWQCLAKRFESSKAAQTEAKAAAAMVPEPEEAETASTECSSAVCCTIM